MADFKDKILGGKYKIEKQLGAGGMGQVWQAYDLTLKRRVAIKFIKEDPSSWSKRTLDRFKEEALILAGLEHPHILRVYDFVDETDGPESLIYLVMSLAVGGSLMDRLQNSGPLTFTETEAIFTQVCQAIDFAHKKRVIHFDLKPSNILFDEAGNVLVADFGLSKILEETTHVKASTWAGTPGYMAPEQMWGDEAGPESDVYALGIILYQMLTGEIPQRFYDDGPMVYLEDFLPPKIKSVIEVATKTSRKERHASADELAWEVKEAIPRNVDEAFIKEFFAPGGCCCYSIAYSPNGRRLAISSIYRKNYIGETFDWDAFLASKSLAISSIDRNNIDSDEPPIDRNNIDSDEPPINSNNIDSDEPPIDRNNIDSDEPPMCVVNINTEQVQGFLADYADYHVKFLSPSFNHNGQFLAGQKDSGIIYIWDCINGKILRRLDLAKSNEVAFSPTSNLLAYACADGTIVLDDWNNNQPAQRLEEQAAGVSSIAFSPDGTLLASAYQDGSVRLWNVDNRQEVKRLENVNAVKVVFSPNMQFLAVTSGLQDWWRDNKVVISLWHLESGERVWQINRETQHPVSIAFSPNSRMLAIGTGINTNDTVCIELWDIENQHQIWKELGGSRFWYCVAFNRQGCLILVDGDGGIQLYRP